MQIVGFSMRRLICRINLLGGAPNFTERGTCLLFQESWSAGRSTIRLLGTYSETSCVFRKHIPCKHRPTAAAQAYHRICFSQPVVEILQDPSRRTVVYLRTKELWLHSLVNGCPLQIPDSLGASATSLSTRTYDFSSLYTTLSD